MLKTEELIYEIVDKNLDVFIEDDITKTYSNIKEFSIYFESYINHVYNELNDIVSIEEGSFFNYISSYFTDPANSQLSRLFNFGLIGADFGAKFAFTGQFGSGIAAVLTKLGLASGFASAGAATAPFVILITAFAISKYLSDSEVRITKKLIETSRKISLILKFNFKQIDKFNKLIKSNCSLVDKKSKAKCASNIFITEYNKNILSPMIIAYIKYLNSNRINKSGIHNFEQLFTFKDSDNKNLSKLIRQFYVDYNKVLKSFSKHDPSIVGKSFSYLNSIVKQNI
jgi:hypothetical protein